MNKTSRPETTPDTQHEATALADTTGGGVLAAQLAKMLELVSASRDSHCAAVQDKAAQQERALLRQARSEARQRVHTAIVEARARLAEERQTARAALLTRQRQRHQAQVQSLLDTAWPRLDDALSTLWQDPASRAVWLEQAVAQALAVLPAQPWVISHPADWEAADLETAVPGGVTVQGQPLLAAIEAHCGQAPELQADPALATGLRLSCDGACVDASAQGLLTDRQGVQARLLALLTAEAAATGKDDSA